MTTPETSAAASTGGLPTSGPSIAFTVGTPDAEEVAAVTAAILALVADAPAAPPPHRSAWSRADRFEQVGQAPFHSRTDPRLVHRPSGALSPGSQRGDE